MRVHRSEQGITEFLNPSSEIERHLRKGELVAGVAIYLTQQGRESEQFAEIDTAEVQGFYRGDIVYIEQRDLTKTASPFERAHAVRADIQAATEEVDGRFRGEFPLAS